MYKKRQTLSGPIVFFGAVEQCSSGVYFPCGWRRLAAEVGPAVAAEQLGCEQVIVLGLACANCTPFASYGILNNKWVEFVFGSSFKRARIKAGRGKAIDLPAPTIMRSQKLSLGGCAQMLGSLSKDLLTLLPCRAERPVNLAI